MFVCFLFLSLNFLSNVSAIKKLEAKVVKKSVNGLEVDILPDEIRAVLPTMHLSDHTSNCPLLWEALQEGDVISNVVCVNRKKLNIVSALLLCELSG